MITFVPSASATTAVPKPDAKGKTPGIELATLVAQVTGIAISPMLGVSGVGAYKHFQAHRPEEKAALPWFAQISFWLPALLLVGLGAGKDTIAPLLLPGMKKPLDVAETVENKISGLVAAGAVVALARLISGGLAFKFSVISRFAPERRRRAFRRNHTLPSEVHRWTASAPAKGSVATAARLIEVFDSARGDIC